MSEQCIVGLLVKNGHQILQTNYRSPFAEIDIISQFRKKLLFFEVKASDARNHFPIGDRVDTRKINKIYHTANLWISINGRYSSFDREIWLAEVLLSSKKKKLIVNFIELRV